MLLLLPFGASIHDEDTVQISTVATVLRLLGWLKEIKLMFNESTEFIKKITHYLAKDQTSWHFNPPAFPHHGRIREAAVKSTKHHLRKIVGDSTFTFKEFYTLLSQIEACLNSRPPPPYL